MGSQTVDDVKLGAEKFAHLLHQVIDRVAHPTEADRLAMHDLVTQVSGGITAGRAEHAMTDADGYSAAVDAGAYEEPEPAPVPLTPDQLRIQELEAQINAINAAKPAPGTPPEQSPATATAPSSPFFSGGPGDAAPPETTAGDSPADVTGAPDAAGG